MRKTRVLFITGTDTGVGKTIVTLCLGTQLQAQGYDVGVLKPAQCAGNDAQFLKKSLGIEDELKVINPFFAPEALSPHLAFRCAHLTFKKQRIKKNLKILSARHDIVLVEGAGGLMVPLTDKYYNADLIKDLKAEVVIVARPGLGTINHTLLTINELKKRGSKIKGVVFCRTRPSVKTLPERTNPNEIKKLSGVKVLGTVPYLKSLTRKNILRRCRNLKLDV